MKFNKTVYSFRSNQRSIATNYNNIPVKISKKRNSLIYRITCTELRRLKNTFGVFIIFYKKFFNLFSFMPDNYIIFIDISGIIYRILNMEWSTLGNSDFILVPFPAARIIDLTFLFNIIPFLFPYNTIFARKLEYVLKKNYYLIKVNIFLKA